MRGARVVHLVPALFGHDGGVVGGAERYALELARHMAEVAPTTLVSFGDETRRAVVGSLEIRVIARPWYVRGQRANPFKLSVFSELARATVVHCHQQHIVASSAAALFGRLTGRPVFVTDLGGGGWDISGYVSTDRWFRGHLHISEFSRQVCGHAGEPWARVILGGVDPDKFSPDPAVTREDAVLFVGRMLPHKGVDDLVKAMDPDAPLELIGPAPDRRYLGDLERLSRGKRVRFRHRCDDAELVRAYRRARCVVLPSVYRTMYGDHTPVPELLGQALLEAMACGTPVIGTRVGSLPEIVADHVTGFLVPPGDPTALGERLAWIRDHPAEAAAMGEAGRSRVLERFTWPAVVRRCLEAYAGTAPALGTA